MKHHQEKLPTSSFFWLCLFFLVILFFRTSRWDGYGAEYFLRRLRTESLRAYWLISWRHHDLLVRGQPVEWTIANCPEDLYFTGFFERPKDSEMFLFPVRLLCLWFSVAYLIHAYIISDPEWGEWSFFRSIVVIVFLSLLLGQEERSVYRKGTDGIREKRSKR